MQELGFFYEVLHQNASSDKTVFSHRMKIALSILLGLLTFTSWSQISYEPVFINQCTQEEEEVIHWHLKGANGSNYGFENLYSKRITVPATGTYSIYDESLEPIATVEITGKGIYRDTVFLKRLELRTYISSPPSSEYYDCDSLANGAVTDYYANGHLRMKGVFENGQAIDSLFSYYQSGQLSELVVNTEGHWKRMEYYETGPLKSHYDTKKAFDRSYYPSGQLKTEDRWSKRYRSITKRYFESGQLQEITRRKKRKRFQEDGLLVERIKRKEILIMDRLFSKNVWERHRKFYEYEWENCDADGKLKRRIIFFNDGFSTGPFPKHLNEIDDFLFQEIVFFEEGEASIKIDAKYVSENDDYFKKLFVSRKTEGEWIEEKVAAIDQVYRLIAEYSE